MSKHPKQVEGDYYGKGRDGATKYDTWALALDTRMPFSQACVIKYIQRYPHKGCAVKDLDKAMTYIDGLASHRLPEEGVLPEFRTDEYIAWLTQCVERFIDGGAFHGLEATAIRMVAQLHLYPVPPRVQVDTIREAIKAMKAAWLAASGEG